MRSYLIFPASSSSCLITVAMFSAHCLFFVSPSLLGLVWIREIYCLFLGLLNLNFPLSLLNADLIVFSNSSSSKGGKHFFSFSDLTAIIMVESSSPLACRAHATRYIISFLPPCLISAGTMSASVCSVSELPFKNLKTVLLASDIPYSAKVCSHWYSFPLL